MAQETGTWIDPELDTIFLWDHVEEKAASCEMATGAIYWLELLRGEVENRIWHNPASALGTRLRPNSLNKACHVATPESIFANIFDDDHNFESQEKRFFRKFLKNGEYAALTFVWNCYDALSLEDDDMELVEESDDYSWNRYSS
jgi:hypothetical protein